MQKPTPIQANCLNCGAILTGKYCAQCGQKADVKKLNWHSFTEEIFHFFTHIEKGFLKTTKQVVLHPGKLCKDYLDGKRKAYHKPVGFLLIWITIAVFSRWLVNHFITPEVTLNSTLITWDSSILDVIARYRALIELLMTPLMAFVWWLILARPKLNYIEALSIYFYVFAFTFMIHTTHNTINLILGINKTSNSSEYRAMAVIACWVLYASYDVYKRYAVSFLIPRLLLWMVVTFLTYMNTIKVIAKAFTALNL